MESSRDDALPPITSDSLAEQAHRVIRAQILTGQLAAGELLKDSVLATTLGVSRAPVRQALDRLVQSGLATKLPNKPYRVVRIDPQSLSELQLLRFADESAAIIHLVTHRVPVEALQEELAELARLVAEDAGWAAIVDADLAFHRRVVSLTGLPRLLSRYDGICDQVRMWLASVEVPSFVVDTQVHRHVEMFESLVECQGTGDTRPAIALWEAHLLGDNRSMMHAGSAQDDEEELDAHEEPEAGDESGTGDEPGTDEDAAGSTWPG